MQSEEIDLENDSATFQKPKFKTVNRSKSKRHKKSRNPKSYIKRNLALISSALFLSGAIGMIVVGAIRFSDMEAQSVHDVILNFYFLFLGLTLALHQFEVTCAMKNFRFLEYHWGKSLLCLFLCSISFSNNQETFIQYVTSLYFFIVGMCFLVLTCTDKKHDRDIDIRYEHQQAAQSLTPGTDFIATMADTKARVSKFADSAGNIAREIEKNVHLTNDALKQQAYWSECESSGIDSDGEVRGKNAIPRPYF